MPSGLISIFFGQADGLSTTVKGYILFFIQIEVCFKGTTLYQRVNRDLRLATVEMRSRVSCPYHVAYRMTLEDGKYIIVHPQY
jgi:hypothetical protein